MNGTENSPLGLQLGEAAQEELAEATGLLDLAEDRLDDLLAPDPATDRRPGRLRRAPRLSLVAMAATRLPQRLAQVPVAATVPCFCRPVAP